MGARERSQLETRERIAAATAELHEQKGVAATTVSEIARLAGVSRLTVYNHFPDLESLLPACSAHYEARHPRPDLAAALAVADPEERAAGTLALVYGWYRENQALLRHVFSDRASVPEVDRFLAEGLDRLPEEVADALADGAAAARVLARVASDFWTWSTLVTQGLDDEAAARLMSRTLVAAAADDDAPGVLRAVGE